MTDQTTEEQAESIKELIARAREACPHPFKYLSFSAIHISQEKVDILGNIRKAYVGNIYREWTCEACESNGIQNGLLSWDSDLIQIPESSII